MEKALGQLVMVSWWLSMQIADLITVNKFGGLTNVYEMNSTNDMLQKFTNGVRRYWYSWVTLLAYTVKVALTVSFSLECSN